MDLIPLLRNATAYLTCLLPTISKSGDYLSVMAATSIPPRCQHEASVVSPKVTELTHGDATIDPTLDREPLQLLVCPRDHQILEERDGHLICPSGHRYPIVEGIPILLLSETPRPTWKALVPCRPEHRLNPAPHDYRARRREKLIRSPRTSLPRRTACCISD